MLHLQPPTQVICLITGIFLLASCGGGGGSTGTATPPATEVKVVTSEPVVTPVVVTPVQPVTGTAMGAGGLQTIALAAATDQHGFIQKGEGVFAGDYIGKLDSLGNSAGWDGAVTAGIASGGAIGYYQDDLLGTSTQTFEQNGWVAGNKDNAGGVGNFFRYVLLKKPAATYANSYMGVYANATNNGYVDVSTYSSIKFKLWGPAEMYQQPNLSPVVELILTGPKVAGCTATGSGGTEITKNLTANLKIGAASGYTVSLAGWTVKGVCGTDTSATAVQAVLSKLSRFVANIPSSSFNFTNATGSDPSLFPTGVNLGPIALIK
jgi:hypothetical protein